jgi:hypothetical protein
MKKTMAVVGVVLGLMAGCVNAASVMVYFNRLLRQSLAFLVLGASLAQTATAAVQVVFSEDFNVVTSGTFNGGQLDSGLRVAYGNNISGWTKSGANSIHVVDRANVNPSTANPVNYAVMVWQDTLTHSAIANSNVTGQVYSVSF